MFKNIYVFILLFISSFTFAQGPSGGFSVQQGDISMTIVDSITGLPVEFATVALSIKDFDKIINGAVTDATGSIKLDKINPGKYALTISFIGYKNKVIDTIKINSKRYSINIGQVKIVPNDFMLKEVEIKGQAALIETKVDRIVYNAEKDLTSSGGNATDILRKVPTLVVDLDGNIQMRGSSNIRVLINGKPSAVMASNVSDALKMIPSDQIKSVEVITSPSAKYDAEGTAGIINIITKTKKIEGFNGSINGSGGTRFVNGSLNLNYRRGDLGVTLSGGTNGFISQSSNIYFERNQYSTDATSRLIQDGTSAVARFGYNVGLGLDYDLNASNNLSTNIRLNNFGFNTDANIGISNTIFSIDTLQVLGNRKSKNNFENIGLDWSVDYKKTFKTKGHELSASFQYGKNKSINDYTTNSSGLVSIMDQSNNNGINNEYTLQTDYIHPINEKVTFETGLKSILRTIDSDSKYALFNASTNNYEIDNTRSNILNYTQNVYAGYGLVSFQLPFQINAKTGLRLEHTEIEGKFNKPDLEPINPNKYNTLIPTINLSKSFNAIHNFKLSYSKRLQRPSLFYLNPFVNSSDPKNISKGNPALLPEIAHLTELSYSIYYKKVVVNAALYYRRTQDIIESYVQVQNNGISYTTFKNVGVNNSIGLNAFGSWEIIKPWTLRGNVNVYTYNLNSNNIVATNTNNQMMYNLALISSWSFNNGWFAEFFGLFNSARYTSQGKNPSFSIYSFGFKKEFNNKRASLGLNISNPFTPDQKFTTDLRGQDFYQFNEIKVPFRTINLSFNWQFGKMEFKGSKKKNINNDDLKQGDGSGMGN
ncbi:MAG: TonB-dependent receptor [Saprospiraceae bacterium]|nr:TonB-dependent receptor [Saprospiraceae bacterium]